MSLKPLSEEECLKEAASHSLSGWAIDPETTTLVDIAARTALRERYLQPCVTTLGRYQIHLGKHEMHQYTLLRSISKFLATGDNEDEEDNEVTR